MSILCDVGNAKAFGSRIGREQHLRLFCILRKLETILSACLGVTAKKEQINLWNYDSVKDFLEQNPYFAQLFNEYEGKFACLYDVNGIDVLIYNVGGRPEIWFGNMLNFINQRDHLDNAISFVRLAYQVINDISVQIS